MSPGEDIMDHIRHEEWHRREVVFAAFEAAIGGTEDQGRNSLLN
jgi:hypothetical protein